MTTLNWGILGTGAIASAFAYGLRQSTKGSLKAIGSREQQSAKAFATEYGVPHHYGSYESLLEDQEVHAIYISTPHPFHAKWAVKALEANKHVLCEKPLGLNHAQGMVMVEAARENHVFFMEAFMYRCHPQTAKLLELLKDGAVGQIRMIRASFGFGGGDSINPESRIFDKGLGGGGILDVGGYPVSMCRLIAGVAEGKQFANPIDVVGKGHLGETGVDEWAAAILKFESDMIAQTATAVRVSLDNTLEINGSEGCITVPNPWVCHRQEPEQGRIILQTKVKKHVLNIPADQTSFAYEADHVADAIASGKTEAIWPAMNWQDTLGNLATLDSWRHAIGLTYEDELDSGNSPIRGKLRKREDHLMQYGKIDGLDKPVSLMIMGCDNQLTYAHGSAVWDDWYERGGNAFDTAWIYGGGSMESLLGQWIKSRDIREEIVVVVKGGHTPRCFPDLIIKDFEQSLDRLQIDYADLYIMHRENSDVPVGEFVDVLNELKNSNLIQGAFGGSNWSIECFEAANEYATSQGKHTFKIMSNNLSLACMVEPVWDGCVHVSDIASRNWLKQTGTTNLAWSSQSRGYFLPERERMKLGYENFTCWDSRENQGRRNRAEQLAETKGCTPINIAAAYVLHQPFSSFAVIGPRTLQETITTLPALQIELTQEEIDWLWGCD